MSSDGRWSVVYNLSRGTNLISSVIVSTKWPICSTQKVPFDDVLRTVAPLREDAPAHRPSMTRPATSMLLESPTLCAPILSTR